MKKTVVRQHGLVSRTRKSEKKCSKKLWRCRADPPGASRSAAPTGRYGTFSNNSLAGYCACCAVLDSSRYAETDTGIRCADLPDKASLIVGLVIAVEAQAEVYISRAYLR